MKRADMTYETPRGPIPLTNNLTRLQRIDLRRICQDWLAFLASRPISIRTDDGERTDAFFAEE